MTPWARRDLRLGLVAVVVAAAGCSSGGAASAPEPRRSVVDSTSIDRQPGREIEKSLEGKFPGVVVRQTSDGGIAVRIRGGSSAYGNNEPLYVLDGMPIQPGPSGALSGVNPHDIESIKVLKEPAETAMYGSRGANGVIIIKTKTARPK